jgi:sigma-54-specific transcriptional regulator
VDKLLTLPESSLSPSSIRAKALVFHDEHSRALLEQVERLARSEATVLVTGETGTGKELIARHVHNTSGRRGPFVAVNCGAFSETLIDAELFGHEAGAFTGAVHARAGWFEAANGGTLFLDEIGDLPLALQVKLLRVLQERQVVRLGSRRSVALDVRLVAGTNIDLARAVESQRFRADLYYRLSVAGVALPPLRERPGDILPLAEHFIQFYSGRLSLKDMRLSDAARAALLAYAWPGNIRELENVVHLALIVARDRIIQAADLRLVPLSVQPAAAQPDDTPAPQARRAAAPEPAVPASTDPFARLLGAWEELITRNEPQLYDRLEEALVHSAYNLCRQNQVRTAKALGISRNILRSLLKRHGLIASPAREGGEGGSGESSAEDTAQATTAAGPSRSSPAWAGWREAVVS